MASLGEMINNPGGLPGQEPEAGSWSDLVKDPVARSALLGFGLQMMTGGWGNGTQQLAAGLGAGATSAAATSEAMRQQMEADEKAAATEANQAANRENALKVAKIGADSRAEVAGIRTAAMLERTQLIQGAKTPDEMRFYSTAYDRAYAEEKKNQILSRKTDEQIRDEAAATAQRKLVEMRAARGQIPPDSGATSPNAPGAPGSAVPGQSPGQTPGAKPAAQNNVLDQALSDPKLGPILQQKLSTEEGQLELISRNKANKVLVDEWNRRNGSKPNPYATINGAIQRGR